MKKVFLGIGAFLLFLILFLAVAPFLFKDKIKAAIDQQLNKALLAKTYYDANSFSLSFFRSFPSASVGLERFGVVGIGAFEGDTLAQMGRLAIDIDLMSVLRGSQIRINSIELDRPQINAIKLANGQANWDIARPDTAPAKEDTEEVSKFDIAIKKWKITDGIISYTDLQAPMRFLAVDFDHEGSGDFTQDLLDLSTKTSIASVSLEMDSASYLSGQKLTAELDAEINQKEGRYTLRETEVKLNDMGIAVDGSVQMPADSSIVMDLGFKTVNADFKQLLSLVPGIYTKDFAGIKAEGEFSFGGTAKGIYKGTNLPKFDVGLKVVDGQFQYPGLPSAVTAINIDLAIAHGQGLLENIAINMRQLAMKVGKNPITAQAKVSGIENMLIDGNLKAKLNLAEISQAFPLDGLTMKGLLNLDASAKGVYSDARKRIPAIVADLRLLEGYVKSKDFPEPIENMSVVANIQNGTGRMEDTRIKIPAMSFLLDGEPFTASAVIEDLVNYRWDIAAKGTIDLAKITKIYKIEGTTVAGKLKADLSTRGTMADVNAGRYDRLPTTGTLGLSNFSYASTDFPQGAKASEAGFSISPTTLSMDKFIGFVGKSDVDLAGSLSNYWGWFLKGQTLKGNLTMKSKRFDANEWMSSTPAPEKPSPEPTKAVSVPRNLDFAVSTTIGEMAYQNVEMKNIAGKIFVQDGVVRMEHLFFNALDGSLDMSGTYDSRNVAAPAFDMAFDMKDVSIAKTAVTFGSVKAFAPVAENMTGKMTTKFVMSGTMNEKMEPNYNSLTGDGFASIADASLSNVSFVQGLNSVAKTSLPTSAAFKNLLLKGSLVGGRLVFKPFDFNLGGQKFTMGGSNGLDKSIAWDLNTALPAGSVGALQNNLPANMAMPAANTPVDLLFKVTGTQTSPKVSLTSVGKATFALLGQQAKDRAKAEADRIKNEAINKGKAEADKLKNEAEARVKAEAERLKNEAKNKAAEELKKLKGKFKL